MHGARLYLQAVEVRTGFIKCFLIKENTALSNILAITDIINLNKSYQHQLKALRFDAGSVNLSQELTDFLTENNIQPASAAPEQQQQNPTKRYRQTIQKRMACNQVNQLLLGPQFWGHNLHSVEQAMNCFANTLCPRTSPTFELTNVQPQLSLFNNKFGQPGIVPIVGETILTPFDVKLRHKSKLDPLNEFVVSLGSPASKNHSILVVIPGRNNLQPSWRYGFTSIPSQDR